MNYRFKKRAAFSIIFSSMLFVMLTTIAMLFLYPGGYEIFNTPIDVDHYIFKINFFSDLGMLQTVTGESNIASAIFFCIALASVGVCFLIYAITLPAYFAKRTIQRKFAIVGSVIASISALGFIGIAFTPWDVFLWAHIFFVFIAFPVSIGYAIFFSISIFMKSTYPNFFAYMLILFAVAMGVYLVFLFGVRIIGLRGLIIAALAQKAIVYIMIILIPLQGVGSLIALKRESNT
jgi:hypothetical protein